METLSLKGFEKEPIFVQKNTTEPESTINNSGKFAIADTVEESLLKLTQSRGIKVKSVCLPLKFKAGVISEKKCLDWLSNTVHNEFYSSRVLFLKYNPEGAREDWQNNKATNRRYVETTALYRKGLYFNKLFQTNS